MVAKSTDGEYHDHKHRLKPQAHNKAQSMAELIQLRQRVKAIETIKKITHAMRLISMSTHARLKGKHDPLLTYKNTLRTLFSRVHQYAPGWTHPVFFPPAHQKHHTLLIIISSNKGLCGSFNSQVFKFLEKQRHHTQEPISYIVAGQRAIDYVHTIPGAHVLLSYTDISIQHLNAHAQECTRLIMDGNFTHVHTIGNVFKTFFRQTPQENTLIPYAWQYREPVEEYTWEQSPEELLPILAEQYLKVRIYRAFFESLLAEQAARFLSMDNATRNAHTLLEETQLQYNKARQLKITKELTELMGSM